MREFIDKIIAKLKKEIVFQEPGYNVVRVDNTISMIENIYDEVKDNYVRKTTLDQYMWERDVAISQLNEIGLDLGNDMSNVKILLDKMDKISKIMHIYEKTFDWGCNDSVHPIIAHAIYGVMSGKESFLEEYNEFLKREFGK